MSLYVIAYDVESNKVRNKIHKLLSAESFSLQYSVFLFDGTSQQLANLKDKLFAELHEDDRLLCIAINRQGKHYKHPTKSNHAFTAIYTCHTLELLLN